ncbi:MAG: hypothetical protein UY03_C0014G0032 [Parcubacteria group bacterium GW2011_GWA2_47_64]|nr:MAG: hypothetical protein UY03_C0014G0032 [Parcubacteria group bacterium GW2011_GWA2_47_64]
MYYVKWNVRGLRRLFPFAFKTLTDSITDLRQRHTMAKSGPIEAEVTDVIRTEKGLYAVTRPKGSNPLLRQGETVTFSLEAWQGKRVPKTGQVVSLFEVEKFRKGWRAGRVEPISL